MNPEDILDAETAQKLMQKGALSKDFWDRVYAKNEAEMAVEEDASADAMADAITDQIQTNPQFQAVATKIAENFMPEAAPAPAGTPMPQIQAPGTEVPAATPQAVVPPSAPPEKFVGPSPEPMAEEELHLQDAERAKTEAIGLAQGAQQAAASGASPPSILDMQIAGLQQQRRGIAAEAAAISQGARQEVATLGQVFKEAGEKAAEGEQKRIQYQSEFDRLLGIQEKAVNDYASLKIDPNRLYANMSTFEKVMAGISVGLGGFGAGAGGGENKGFAAIKQAIKDDVQLQKDQIDVLGNAVQFRSNLLNDVRQRVGDQLTAEQVTQAILLNRAKLQVDAIQASTKSAQAQANATKLSGALTVEMGKLMKEAGAGLSGQAMANVENGGPTRKFDLSTKEGRAMAALYVPNVGMVGSAPAARELADQKAAADSLIKTLGKLEGLFSQHGPTLLPTEARAEAESLWAQMLAEIKQAKRLGALDAGVKEFGGLLIPEDPLGARMFKPWDFITKRPGVMLTRVREAQEYTRSSFYNAVSANVQDPDPAFLASMAPRQAEQKFAKQKITDSTE